jgi:pimeloyl-ACP methyl ester carboxylesterase
MATLVLVHGAFVDSGYWAETAEALRAAGRDVILVDLPGAGRDPDALGDSEADRAALRSAIDGVGGPVVLVAHSLGGFPVTALADHPSVVHTTYVAAFVPREGEAPLQLLAEAGGPTDWVVPGEKAFATIDDTDRLREILLGDVEPERARRELARLGYQSAAGAMTPALAPARRHPVTYVITDQDVAIPPAAQARFAEVAGAAEVVHLPSAHQPMTSMPARLAAVLGAAG